MRFLNNLSGDFLERLSGGNMDRHSRTTSGTWGN